MTGLKVVLASASPRRKELLKLVGIEHEVRPSNIDETMHPGETPRAHVERLAREKATAVAAGHQSAITIAADTIVVVDGEVLGKPADTTVAKRMLRMLSGREHTVLTAVAVSRGGELRSSVEEVAVSFRRLRDDEIEDYVATGEPMDKAGAYGIQGFGATIVERVEGDYFAVMGLPLVRLIALLEQLGVIYKFGSLQQARAATVR
jgi:nucleoside triphosphate pyrophosphatase